MTKTQKKEKKHRGVLFLEGIPESTKSAFKAACAKNQVTMREAMIELMRSYATDPR